MSGESDKLKEDLEELRASISRIKDDLKALRDAQAEELKSYARRNAERAREGVREIASEATAKTKESTEAFESLVRENPLRSVLAAFGLGLVIAQLLRRR